MKKEIDTSRPHSGRVYDYLLGGTQNFEADRQVASALLKMSPGAGVLAKCNRWFLQFVANRWAEEGLARILDLGSGLPTQGHFNEALPDAQILFTDHDLLSVEYGNDILANHPNMRYVHADLRDVDRLIETAAGFFGGERRLGIGVIGISYFLSDEELSRLMQAIHKFSAPGTVMAVSYFLGTHTEGKLSAMLDLYLKTVRIPVYFREPSQIAKVIAPFRVIEDQALVDLLDIAHLIDTSEPLFHEMKFRGAFAVRD